MPRTEISTRSLASEIERYLARHPDAADTSDGIAKWWLKRQRLEEAVADVNEALAWLVARGRVTCSRSGATAIYSSARAQATTLRAIRATSKTE